MKPSSIFNLFKKIAKISSFKEDYIQALISSGVKIIDYIGKLISKKEAQRNEKFDNKKDIYLFKHSYH